MALIETTNFNVDDYVETVKWVPPLNDDGNPQTEKSKTDEKNSSKSDDGLFAEDYFEQISNSKKPKKKSTTETIENTVLTFTKDLEDSLRGIDFSADGSETKFVEIDKIDEIIMRVDDISSNNDKIIDDINTIQEDIDKINSKQKRIIDMLRAIMTKLEIDYDEVKKKNKLETETA